MALQRQTNPLPPGRYAIVNQGRAIGTFNQWQRINRSIVKVESSSLDSGAVPLGGQVSEFVIFNVLAPAFLWPLATLGFPNVAGPEIKERGDFLQEGEPAPVVPPGFLEFLGDASIITLVLVVLALSSVAGSRR